MGDDAIVALLTSAREEKYPPTKKKTDEDYEQPLRPLQPNKPSLMSDNEIDRLQPDKGDVKVATGNIHFDEGSCLKKAPEEKKEASAPASKQQQHETEGDHLEPSKEPSKPGSAHPVMDSSK